MPKIRFYRQQRYDGGVRTGFGVEDQPLLEAYETGSAESDPALTWYVDIELEGKNLPHDVEAARGWIIDNGQSIISCLRSLAERLAIGLDDTTQWPYLIAIDGLPRGVRGDVRISAVRGLAEGELAQRLNQLAAEWTATIRRLAPMAHV
jgi:hypothetical protein